MLPNFDNRGNLPAGIHSAAWSEFCDRFGGTSRHRDLLEGVRRALDCLRIAGCALVYIDGSFVSTKAEPGDFDACWSVEGVDAKLLDPVFLDFSNGRAAQKARFGGELFPAELPEGVSGKVFLNFFQTDRETGRRKGIVSILLAGADLTGTETNKYQEE